MTLSTVHAQNQVTQFRKKFVTEYSRHNQFANDMGTTSQSVIFVNRDLTRLSGKRMSTPLVPNLAEDDGITGNSQAEGNETFLSNFGHEVEIEMYRKPVATTEREKQYTEIDLMKAARDVQMNWKLALLRNHIIRELAAIRTTTTSDQGVAYGTASEAEKDAWLVANSDRVLFGDGSVGGFTDSSADLALITAGMTMDGATLSLAKRKAESATDYKLSPVSVKNDQNEEWFKVYMHSRLFRDLWLDPDVREAHLQALPRAKDNPLHRGGDIIWDGMIIRKVQDIPVTGNVGTASAPVAPYYICGQGALTAAYAKDAFFTFEKRDYGFVDGVCVNVHYNVRKVTYLSSTSVYKDFGVFTGFASAPAD